MFLDFISYSLVYKIERLVGYCTY